MNSSGCADVPVEVGDVPSDTMWSAITNCAALFIDGPVPEALNERGLWNLPSLEVVVATAGTRFNPPLSHWSVSSLVFDHAALGGVTDGKYNLTAYTRANQWGRVAEWARDERPR